MHGKELDLIKEVMEELCEQMEYGEDDFANRLGKKKPDVAILKIEGKTDEMPEGMDEESAEVKGPMMSDSGLDGEDMSPEDSLKQRLMRLRG